MSNKRIDWSRFDAEEVVRGLNEEEREKRLGEISMIMELQGKINKLKITLEMIKRQREDDDDDRRCRESYKRNKREREEKKDRRRIDDK